MRWDEGREGRSAASLLFCLLLLLWNRPNSGERCSLERLPCAHIHMCAQNKAVCLWVWAVLTGWWGSPHGAVSALAVRLCKAVCDKASCLTPAGGRPALKGAAQLRPVRGTDHGASIVVGGHAVQV